MGQSLILGRVSSVRCANRDGQISVEGDERSASAEGRKKPLPPGGSPPVHHLRNRDINRPNARKRTTTDAACSRRADRVPARRRPYALNPDFPVDGKRVAVDADLVNRSFKRFMVKDYVKSIKGTSFPKLVETPVVQDELDGLIDEFIRLRGSLSPAVSY